jgi:DNA replication protein DnaC/transposase
MRSWLGGMARALTFYGGCPQLIVPDNPRSLVSVACRYDPKLNDTVRDFARHYSVSILPARPYSPKDKATAESAVQVVTRWVLAQLRHTVLADVHAADAAIAALMPSLNNRAFQKLDGSRASLFASLDSPALSPLPMQPWQWATFKKVTVHIDYHVEVEAHRYSVHHPLVGLEMEARITDALVEVLHRGQRVACHARNEDVDGRAGRGFERPMLMSLALSRWVEDGTAILITGPAGSGKSWLACALAQYACRRGQSALYLRAPRLADELRIQHGNGGFARWLGAVARTDVLVLDDWGLATLDGPTRSDLLEIIDDRAGTRATIVTSQLPVEHWHAWIGDATIADAILDRLLSRSQRLALKGKSLRPDKQAGAAAPADPVAAQDSTK